MQPLSPRVALIANGEIVSYSKTKHLLAHYEKIIAIDGGLKHCEKMEIIPHMIIGDMDSISKQELKNYPDIPILKYPKEKDESDLELAINYLIEQSIDSMALFGVLGFRVDHLLYTLYLVARHPTKLLIESDEETIFCLQRENDVASFPGQTISMIPLGTVSGITTKGLQWELHQATFDKQFMSLSNVCLGSSFKVNVQTGNLLCCLQKNEN